MVFLRNNSENNNCFPTEILTKSRFFYRNLENRLTTPTHTARHKKRKQKTNDRRPVPSRPVPSRPVPSRPVPSRPVPSCRRTSKTNWRTSNGNRRTSIGDILSFVVMMTFSLFAGNIPQIVLLSIFDKEPRTGGNKSYLFSFFTIGHKLVATNRTSNHSSHSHRPTEGLAIK